MEIDSPVEDRISRTFKIVDTILKKIYGCSTQTAAPVACLVRRHLHKEIGIRKVMGAGLLSIFVVLNSQYAWMAFIAFVIAAPVSWFIMNEWLMSFQFRITIGWELFAISMLAGLTIVMITVGYHSVRTAMINPAETLKYE